MRIKALKRSNKLANLPNARDVSLSGWQWLQCVSPRRARLRLLKEKRIPNKQSSGAKAIIILYSKLRLLEFKNRKIQKEKGELFWHMAFECCFTVYFRICPNLIRTCVFSAKQGQCFSSYPVPAQVSPHVCACVLAPVPPPFWSHKSSWSLLRA